MAQDDIEWPSMLPTLQAAGHKHDKNRELLVPRNNLGFSPDIRQRQKRPPEIISGKLRLTDIQQTIFDWFYHRQLYDGALWFIMPLLIDGTLQKKRVKIINNIKTTLNFPYWDTSLQIELYD